MFCFIISKPVPLRRILSILCNDFNHYLITLCVIPGLETSTLIKDEKRKMCIKSYTRQRVILVVKGERKATTTTRLSEIKY